MDVMSRAVRLFGGGPSSTWLPPDLGRLVVAPRCAREDASQGRAKALAKVSLHLPGRVRSRTSLHFAAQTWI